MDDPYDTTPLPSRSPLMKALLTISRGSSAGVGLLAVLGVLVIVGRATDRWMAGPWFLPLALVVAVCVSAVAGLTQRP